MTVYFLTLEEAILVPTKNAVCLPFPQNKPKRGQLLLSEKKRTERCPFSKADCKKRTSVPATDILSFLSCTPDSAFIPNGLHLHVSF